MQLLTDTLKQLIGARHPILYAAADHLFGAGGKRLRPAVVLLLSRATMPGQEITPRHRRLAEITEMIHTASLVHDDVVDESSLRRGIPTVHSSFSNRVAVLAGDFLFAQASWHLAHLDSLTVVKL
ncbi:polyprenyl synthetase family protein, partial [Klebsiella pneumoniae]|nr:polyprenyl synthetase family protein [Klebsiella pneumoniae]